MKKYIVVVLLIPCLMLLIFCTYKIISNESAIQSSNQVISIQNVKVFENFQMKKDYDKQIERDLFTESQNLDSLGKILKAMEVLEKNTSNKKTQLQQDFLKAREIFNQKFEQLSKEYTASIYSRLNEYITEYGKEKHCKIIIGANGQGNVMYIDATADKTEELIKYVNKKYQNK